MKRAPMKRPAPSEAGAVLYVRLTSEELRTIQAAAAADMRSVTQWVRRALKHAAAAEAYGRRLGMEPDDA